MSQVKIQGDPGGTGIFTIASPNSNSNVTFTLPTTSGTVLTNAGPYTANASASNGAVTIDASNNVGIGTSSTLGVADRLAVVGGNIAVQRTSGITTFMGDNTQNGYAGTTTNHAFALLTNSTERARITSGGFFKASNSGTYVGSTSAYHELVSNTGDATAVVYIRNTNATSPGGIDLSYSAASPNGTGNTFLYCQDSTTVRMSIRSNGGITNYSANNVNLSDRREKTNFAPAGSYLPKICAIPVQTFNYIDQNMEEDPGLTLGVVAQDVQAVAPELVMESNWGSAEEPKMRLSIYQTDLQYALMKCIQELNAKVAALEARLASDGPSNGGQA